MKVFYSVSEAMADIKTSFGYLTMVNAELPTIERTLHTKAVVKVEGVTYFVDEFHLLD